MLKKLAWLGVAALVAIIAVNATGLAKYCGPLAQKWKAKAEQKIPIEFQIETIKDQIAKLAPDIEAAKTRLAEKRVVVRNLQTEVDTATTRLNDQAGALQARAALLEKPDTLTVYYDSQKVSIAEAKRRLGADLKSYQWAEALLKSKTQLLQTRQEELRFAQEQLEALVAAQKQAEAEVAQLETEMMTVRLAETRSKYQADDSRLADIKQSIQKVKDRLQVAKEKLSLDAQYGTETMPAETQDNGANSVDAVKAYFGSKDAAAKK